MLLLGDFESRNFLRQVQDQKIQMLPPLRTADSGAFARAHDEKLRALQKMDAKSMGMGYQVSDGRASIHCLLPACPSRVSDRPPSKKQAANEQACVQIAMTP